MIRVQETSKINSDQRTSPGKRMSHKLNILLVLNELKPTAFGLRTIQFVEQL